MKKIFVLAAIVALAMMGSAHGDAINYTLGGWVHQYPAPTTPPANAPWGPNGYPGDTVELLEYAGTLDLTPGIYVQAMPENLLWTIDYTYGGTATDPNAWSDVNFGLNVSRTISFGGGGGGSVGQTGSLTAAWDNDYLSFTDGPMSTFYVQGYRVDVTLLGLPQIAGSDFSGGNPWVQPTENMSVRFDVSLAPAPVPEPASMGLLGIGLVGLMVTRIRKRLSA